MRIFAGGVVLSLALCPEAGATSVTDGFIEFFAPDSVQVGEPAQLSVFNVIAIEGAPIFAGEQFYADGAQLVPDSDTLYAASFVFRRPGRHLVGVDANYILWVNYYVLPGCVVQMDGECEPLGEGFPTTATVSEQAWLTVTPATTPVPAALPMFFGGLLGVYTLARRRRATGDAK